MIESACGTEQFALAAIQLRAAVDAIVPIMFLGLDVEFGDPERQQRWYRSDGVRFVFHCVTNLTK
jgi:hypothetical protein